MARAQGGGLILAAGHGRRFGSDKRHVRLADGRTLLISALTPWHEALADLRVVLRDRSEPGEVALAEALTAQFPNLMITFAERWQGGMGASLAAGIADCGDWAYVLIGLGDMPDLRAATISRLSDELQRRCNAGDTMCIVRPVHAVRPGHPIGFGRGHFPELRRTSGDIGARHIVAAHPNVVDLPCDDPGIHHDIDTPDQLP
ncbi:MAG: nucleotidyltransferase family protein [Gammaproteobacteria bacterium]|nr:MAG: nucleotidyltransferase family protein [Gammaproteobacteria bacterium]